MKKRHANKLLDHLEELILTTGYTQIKNEELRLWYGTKMTKNMWRDLRERINDVCEEYEVDPIKTRVYITGEGTLLIHDEDLQSLEDLC